MAGGIDLGARERQLAPLSHGTEALTILRAALGRIEKRARQSFLNQQTADRVCRGQGVT